MTAQLIGRTGSVRGTNAAVDDVLTIGSGPENGILIPSRTVSRRHAQIIKSGTEYFVEDLGSRNGTFLNGQRVQRFPIRHLDVLSIGPDTDLIFLETGTAPAVSQPSESLRSTIEWVDGPLAGRVQEFAAGRRLILGRSVDLPLEAISLRHAALTIADGGATVEDLGSTNGTFVNGKPISKATILADGDEVSLANLVRFRVSLVRGASRDTQRFVEGTGSETILIPGRAAADKPLVVPAPAAPAPAAAASQRPPVTPPPPAPAPAEAQTPAEAQVPAPVPTPEPVPPPSARPGDGTVVAPRAPAVSPAFIAPSTPAGVRTVRPPREAAGGLPANIAARAQAARDAVDATFAVPSGPSKPAPDAVGGAAQEQDVAPGAANVVGVRLDGPENITLNRGTFHVGRHADCDIHLDLRDVGRRHARLVVKENAVTVEDLGSANWTFVNGAPVSTPRIVPDGGTVRFAAVEFTVSYLRSE